MSPKTLMPSVTIPKKCAKIVIYYSYWITDGFYATDTAVLVKAAWIGEAMTGVYRTTIGKNRAVRNMLPAAVFWCKSRQDSDHDVITIESCTSLSSTLSSLCYPRPFTVQYQ